MGAIFGGIKLNDTAELIDMTSSLSFFHSKKYINEYSYKDLKLNVWMFEHCLLGSEVDKGLYVDADILVVANGILDIDNKISISENISNEYKAKGMKMMKTLYGDYSYLIYDKKTQRIYISRDHVGKFILYYIIKEGVLYFSTLINPLVSITKVELNIEWLAIFTTTDINLNSIYEEETAYKNIKIVKIGSYLEIVNESKKYISFQDHRVVNKKHTRKEYLEIVDDVFSKAVNTRLRTNKKVAISLSGGLDSTTVASYASEQLKDENKKLYSYSSIPLASYESHYNKLSIVNEKEFIEEFISMYDNFEHKYTSSEAYNCINVIDKYLKFYESPYKYVVNSPYMLDIAEMASNDGCNILLSGAHGNLTLSLGDIKSYFFELLKRGRIITTIKEMIKYCELYGIGKKQFITGYFIELIVSRFKNEELSLNHLVKKNISDQLMINQKIKDDFLNFSSILPHRQVINYAWNPVILNQMAEYETKLFQETGVLTRDPMRDIRVIEIMSTLPYNAFCNNGMRRMLIIDLMKGKIPNSILFAFSKRGLQGADWVYRLHDEWFFLRQQIINIIKDNPIIEYVDKTELQNLIIKLETIDYKTSNEKEIMQLIRMLILYKHEHLYNEVIGRG